MTKMKRLRYFARRRKNKIFTIWEDPIMEMEAKTRHSDPNSSISSQVASDHALLSLPESHEMKSGSRQLLQKPKVKANIPKSDFETKLPLEIRNKIYGYLCQEDTYSVPGYGMPYNYDLVPCSRPLSATSSQIRNEFLQISEGLSICCFGISDYSWPHIFEWFEGTTGRPQYTRKIKFDWLGKISQIEVDVRITIDLTANPVDDRFELSGAWIRWALLSESDVEIKECLDNIAHEGVKMAEGLYTKRSANQLMSEDIVAVAEEIVDLLS